MDVRIQAFSFMPGKKITQDEFTKFLLDCDEGDFEFAGRSRIFYFSDDVDTEYYVGVLITIKDHKTYCSLKDKSKIFVKATGANEDLMDFNYFVIHKESFRGIYQHYHQSCSLNQFGSFLKKRYNDLRSLKITEEVKAELAKTPSKDAEKLEGKKEHEYGAFKLEIEVRRESLKELLTELAALKSFEYSVYSLEAEENDFVPLASHARKVFRKVTFVKDASVITLAKGIGDFIDKHKLKEGRVKGRDPDGLEKVIDLLENPDYLNRYDFDDITVKIQGLDINDLKGNWLVTELLSVAKNRNMNVKAAA